MSNYQLTFNLKQHTPLIHFQHEQEGATIRATELKPKLDRFIMEQIAGRHDAYETTQEKFKELHPNWLIGKGKNGQVALDYKVKIKSWDEKTVEIATPVLTNSGNFKKSSGGNISTKTYPLYFGNMGKKEEEIDEIKKGKIAKHEITIISFQNEIIDLLKKNNFQLLFWFFFTENFGTRQSKGFGCFYPAGDGNNWSVKWPPFISPLKFTLDLSSLEKLLDKAIDDIHKQNMKPAKTDDFRLFKAIEWFYQFLRSGVNFSVDNTSLYIKPAIFYYAKNIAKEQWDKKSVKQHFFNSERKKQADKYSTPPVLCFKKNEEPTAGNDFKDLLGFSSTERWWLPYRKFLNKSFSVKYKKENGREQIENELIRFKSPIRFHILKRENRIYDVWFWGAPIPENYLKAATTFKIDRNRLKLPMYSDFSCEDFFNKIFKEKKDGKYINALELFQINPSHKQAPHFQVLNAIMNSIQSNLNDEN